MPVKDYDIVIVGSGPNGLSAAILLQQAGLKTILLEAESTVGGGMRSAELTLPGFTHDICSAIHPLAAGSPFLTSLPLEKFGLEFIAPGIAAAHPFDDGSAATMRNFHTGYFIRPGRRRKGIPKSGGSAGERLAPYS